MKKLRVLLLIAFLSGIAVSCNFGTGHTTIIENDNNHYLKIEYSGHVHFSDDGTAISSISRGGYVKYWYNNRKLEARSNGSGGVSYELYNNGERLDPDHDGKPLIAEAVKMMIRKGYHPERK